MPQEIAKLMSEFSVERNSERKFELVQELYALLAEEDQRDRGAGPLDFMLRQGQW